MGLLSRLIGLFDAEPAPLASPPVPDLFVAGKDFHLKEYESLKKELADLVDHSRKLEIYAVGGIAAFYAWFLSKVPSAPPIALYIPVLVGALGAFRSLSVLTRIGEIARYLRRMEKKLALSDSSGQMGWETERESNTSNPFVSSASVFWIILVAVCIFASCQLRDHHPLRVEGSPASKVASFSVPCLCQVPASGPSATPAP